MKKCLLSRAAQLVICSVALLGLMSDQSQAQSAKKTHTGSAAKKMEAGSSAKSTAGSGAKSTMAATLGLEGYCPVCIVVGKGWVQGDPQIQTTYDGKIYYFPSAEVKQMFDADPVKYTPALGGDCTVCLKMLGKRVPGDIKFSSLLGGRLFLFPNEEVKQKFANDVAAFVDVDLASNGNCTVCSVEKHEQVAGSPEFVVMHKGMRYQFPEAEVMNMFVANPTKYEVADPPANK